MSECYPGRNKEGAGRSEEARATPCRSSATFAAARRRRHGSRLKVTVRLAELWIVDAIPRDDVAALSLALYGEARVLPQFPVDRRVRGMGMTVWVGYAYRLAKKFDYVNTFYDELPRLDITGDCRSFGAL